MLTLKAWALACRVPRHTSAIRAVSGDLRFFTCSASPNLNIWALKTKTNYPDFEYAAIKLSAFIEY